MDFSQPFKYSMHLAAYFSLDMEAKVCHPELGNFILNREIGRGSFAVVYSAVYERCQCPVAIKVFDNRIWEDPEELEYVRKEFELQKSVTHPLIPKAHEMFVFAGKLCVVMELVEGSTLLDYANAYGTISEARARRLMGQLVLIIEYLHTELGIVHRDIKCENLIIDNQGNIHLIDFGFARRCEQNYLGENQWFLTTCGSPAYVAPEIIENRPYNFLVDIWSMGVVLYAILCGRLPFENTNISKMLEMVVKTEPEYPPSMSVACHDLLKRMMSKDAATRIGIKEIKEHPWIVFDENKRRQKLDGEIFRTLIKDTTQIDDLDRSVLLTMRLDDKEQGQLISDLLSGKESVFTKMYEILWRARLRLSVGKYAGMIFVADVQRETGRVRTFSHRSHTGLPRLVSSSVVYEKAKDVAEFRLTDPKMKLSHPELPKFSVPVRVHTRSPQRKVVALQGRA